MALDCARCSLVRGRRRLASTGKVSSLGSYKRALMAAIHRGECVAANNARPVPVACAGGLTGRATQAASAAWHHHTRGFVCCRPRSLVPEQVCGLLLLRLLGRLLRCGLRARSCGRRCGFRTRCGFSGRPIHALAGLIWHLVSPNECWHSFAATVTASASPPHLSLPEGTGPCPCLLGPARVA